MADSDPDNEYSENVQSNRYEMLETNKVTDNLTRIEDLPLSGDEQATVPIVKLKKRIKRFSDSDSDKEQNIEHRKVINLPVKPNLDSNSEEEMSSLNYIQKSRIRHFSTSDSDSDSESKDKKLSDKCKEQHTRIKNKKNNLKQKFKSLITSRDKSRPQLDVQMTNEISEHNHRGISDDSNDGMSIIAIKKEIKQATILSICDPDTSDEESSIKKNKHNKNVRKSIKSTSTKPTSPKPVQMSAKQAIENMQKIKSESNRMLREKDVSLPYHRPKALSLKDIIGRRKPAVTVDGKALPIRMNEDQLRQYAMMLEERQKEMMELCKSDTDEEEPPEVEKPSESDKPLELHIDNKVIENENQKIEKETIDFKISQSNEQLPTTNIIAEISIKANEQNNSNGKETIENNYHIENLNAEKFSESSLNTEETNLHNAGLDHTTAIIIKKDTIGTSNENDVAIVGNQSDSQIISLHYDSEKIHNNKENFEVCESISKENSVLDLNKEESHPFDDEDINMDEIDSIIENAEIIKGNSKHEENFNSPMHIKDTQSSTKPKLMGAPGMIIDLDGSDPTTPKKLTGVELLKEKFKYFAKIKTSDELEREKERTFKPGSLHIKLKQELEEKIAEQRSYEWAKRLEEEKLQQMELKTIRGETSNTEDEIDKIEAELAEKESIETEVSLTSADEEEDEEDFVDEVDKPRKRNPLIADEAEESDADDEFDKEENKDNNVDNEDHNDANEDVENEEEPSEEEDSSESENESQMKQKKGRILKAFEDSDEEDTKKSLEEKDKVNNSIEQIIPRHNANRAILENEKTENHPATKNSKNSQDDELQLAQVHKSLSEDLFTSQESDLITYNSNRDKQVNTNSEGTLCSQSFSILSFNANHRNNIEIDLSDCNNLNVICNTQPDGDLGAVDGMCSSSFPQNLIYSQSIKSQTQSQNINEDILALCTGQFYDNQFVSQVEDENEKVDYVSQKKSTVVIPELINANDKEILEENYSNSSEIVNENKSKILNEDNTKPKDMDDYKIKSKEGHILKSILNELDDPEFDSPKPNAYFCGNDTDNKETIQLKKRLVIDSEDEADNTVSIEGNINKKKLKKKKKLEMRALQISDDEEEQYSDEDEEKYMSDLEDYTEKVVDYDSEENEVVIPQDTKKKRKATDFFEQEAELTSEDEWVGSGDEDEVGLDRMEREEGDYEVFHQGQLQRELGKIHMREMLDQDKREVRFIQETLLQDDDLGTGHRQRKFRWRNADGEEETGTVPDEFADTQEDEFESEEQWRKERHEREIFLRQMQEEDKSEEGMNISINRTAIIKANLSSKTMSSLLLEANTSKSEQADSHATEKKQTKDIPSPKKPFTMYQINYHGSLLSRGRGTLARLAALATPLAADADDTTKLGSLAPTKKNFVFATVTPDHDKSKVTKRKANKSNISTPRLVKKMKLEEKQKTHRSSLLDHLNT